MPSRNDAHVTRIPSRLHTPPPFLAICRHPYSLIHSPVFYHTQLDGATSRTPHLPTFSYALLQHHQGHHTATVFPQLLPLPHYGETFVLLHLSLLQLPPSHIAYTSDYSAPVKHLPGCVHFWLTLLPFCRDPCDCLWNHALMHPSTPYFHPQALSHTSLAFSCPLTQQSFCILPQNKTLPPTPICTYSSFLLPNAHHITAASLRGPRSGPSSRCEQPEGPLTSSIYTTPVPV